jgi:hypothetical protein
MIIGAGRERSPMVLGEFLVVLGVAALVTLLLVGALGWQRVENGPLWDSAIFVFLILYPALWVAKVWVRPVGPVFQGVHWVSLLFVGLIVAFIIAATLPRRRRKNVIVIGAAETAVRVRMPFGFFFWLLMLLYVGALLASYVQDGGQLVSG